MMSQAFADIIHFVIISIKDAIGATYSAFIKLLNGDILNPRRLARLALELVLALLLLVAPLIITDLQYVQSSNRTRSYWVHAPDHLDSGKNYSAVIVFHGLSRLGSVADGLAIELDLRLSLPLLRTSYSSDKFFVYPNGVNGAWAGPTYAEVSVQEDLQFVNDMIDDLESKYAIDKKKIYAAGMSNGGGFVGTIACSDLGSRFAAFAAVAGSFYTDYNGRGCKPSRSPLPMMEIHGGDDMVVKYTGGIGHGGPLPSIPDWLQLWEERNQCTSNSTIHTFDNRVHHISWTCIGKPGVLQHWKVDANGHSWPSKSRNMDMLVAGIGPQPIEANDLVVDFFSGYSIP